MHTLPARFAIPQPTPVLAGLGLRPVHCQQILSERPATGWFEVHSENYFGAGGQPLYYLERIRDAYPLSLYGVGLCLGFATAIIERDASQVDGLLDRAGPNDSERLAVYCNNVYDNLREALRAVYPVVERLVGAQFFRQAANRYIHDYPSTSGDIQRFGSSFPSFLARFGPAASLNYLADTAALEWAMHVVFHEADHAPLALARLAQLSEADCSALRFMLHPACRLMSSDFPVFRIWQANQPGARADETIDARASGELLLIRRDGFAVEVERLRRGEFAMLDALLASATVNDAYERALQVDATFRLAEFIQHRIGDATIVDYAVGPRRGYGPACRSAS